MASNFVVNSLPAYVQTNRDILIKNFALVGNGTRTRMSIQTGIKKDAYINYLALAPTLQDGTDCGFNAVGDATLTQRTIATAPIKVNMDICPRKLIGKYAEYLVRNNANAEDLPFEKYIMDGLINEVNKKSEKLIWQGDTSSSDANIKWHDGLLKIAGADSSVIDVTLGGTNVFSDVDLMIASIPEEVIERGAEIYMSPAKFNAYLMKCRDLNFFHYAGAVNDMPQEFVHPGTNVKVVKTAGLAGTNNMVATYAENLYFGCDMEGDLEDIKVWFSDDDDVFKVKILWSQGVQFAFPNMVVLGA